MIIDDFIKILQASVAPVVLISSVGFLLITLNNRLGRSLDRIRILCDKIISDEGKNVPFYEKQIDILYRRCKLIQTAIVFAILTVVCVSIIILMLFSTYVFHTNLIGIAEFLFSAALLSLILSLTFYLQDVITSLLSIRIEIDRTMESRRRS
jgi:hypothetical protein